jgi:hypothetical protein
VATWPSGTFVCSQRSRAGCPVRWSGADNASVSNTARSPWIGVASSSPSV